MNTPLHLSFKGNLSEPLCRRHSSPMVISSFTDPEVEEMLRRAPHEVCEHCSKQWLEARPYLFIRGLSAQKKETMSFYKNQLRPLEQLWKDFWGKKHIPGVGTLHGKVWEPPFPTEDRRTALINNLAGIILVQPDLKAVTLPMRDLLLFMKVVEVVYKNAQAREDKLASLLDAARRHLFIPDTDMTEAKVLLRDRIEYELGLTTMDPDAGPDAP